MKQFAAAVVRIMKNFHLKALLQWQWITEERSVLNSFNGQSRINFYQTKFQKLAYSFVAVLLSFVWDDSGNDSHMCNFAVKYSLRLD